jgi:phosphatidylserine synthase
MKLKDYFTLGNLLCGFAAVIALFLGSFEWSCYLICLGYAFDVLDGRIAKLTKQFDTFGSNLDEVSDYITNSIAMGIIIFYAFWQRAHYHWLLAALIGAFPFTFGTIRQARSMTLQLSYPCYWLGVPRPVSAIFLLALLNSSLFNLGIRPWQDIAHMVAAGLVVFMSIMHLSNIPFVNHHQRRWMTGLRFGMVAFLAVSPISLLLGWLVLKWPGLFFDYLLFNLLVYLLLSWTQIPKTDRQRMRDYIAGGPLIKPLVHKESTWRSHGWADYFLSQEERHPEEQPQKKNIEIPI